MVDRNLSQETREIGHQIIGQTVNCWAMIDQCVDLILLKAFHVRQREGDLEELAKMPWTQLSVKLARLTDVCAAAPFAGHLDDAATSELLSEALRLYESRNDIIHGTASFFPARVHYVRWTVEKRSGQWRRRDVDLTIQELFDFGVQSGDLAKAFHALEEEWQTRWPLPPTAFAIVSN